MATTSGETNPLKSGVESENSADLDQARGGSVSKEEETAANQISAPPEDPGKSQDWWSAPPPTADWAQPAANDETAADVYFCGQTSFFPLNRALQAIVKEKLTGSLRLFWAQEPITHLMQNGEISFATTRDLQLYRP